MTETEIRDPGQTRDYRRRYRPTDLTDCITAAVFKTYQIREGENRITQEGGAPHQTHRFPVGYLAVASVPQCLSPRETALQESKVIEASPAE
ncbi:unnamed protein product [Fusarium graminearum]|uniref:Chromosome 1, complete genome n=1 Tax=Gibberella zeae (strain ATCC MYA-4620 / CBS 123657 / FGSC 9075 / NRRL 31084 / PH-1) TaxID=229533 RepID=A0A0E0RWC5_GIBZE|nr:hypothetical protein FG05_35337 [Fusarium graminearum]CEF75550.1 unnamed protein product [Fusarium graminearum]CZS78829.1 unnamed protein product [Fusarium graminearum]